MTVETHKVGDFLREMRHDALLTQRELAVKMDSHASVVCRLEKGRYGDHNWGTMCRFAAGCERILILSARPLEKPW